MPARRYLWGNAVDQLLAQENIPATGSPDADDLFWILPDRLGSTGDAINASGNVELHYDYDAFGKSYMTETDYALGAIDSADLPRYLYTCQEYDTMTGLYDYGRPYDPKIGKFYSEDSAGLGVDENLYRYCWNNAVNMTDPTGNCGSYAGLGSNSYRSSIFGNDLGASLYGSAFSDPLFSMNTSFNSSIPFSVSSSNPMSLSDFGGSSYNSFGTMNFSSSTPTSIFDDAFSSYSSLSYSPVIPSNLNVNLNNVSSSINTHIPYNSEPMFYDYKQMANVGAGIVEFPSAVGSSFMNGSAWDSFQGASLQTVDAIGNLGTASVNSFARAECSILNTISGQEKQWNDIQLPQVSSIGSLYGNTQAYNNGQVVGDVTARVLVMAATAYGAVTQLPAVVSGLYAYGASAFASVGLGGGGTAALVPSIAGGMATVAAPTAGIIGTAYGAYNSGALDPMMNWMMMKAQNPVANAGNTNVSGPYGHLSDNTRVEAGRIFQPQQKEKILEANRQKNRWQITVR